MYLSKITAELYINKIKKSYLVLTAIPDETCNSFVCVSLKITHSSVSAEK